MSEEYTQGKAYLDAMSRLEKDPFKALHVEVPSVMIAGLKAERDEALKDAKFWEDRFDVCAGQLRGAEIEADRLTKIAGAANTTRYAAIKERDEANKWVSAYLLERNEAHEESETFQRRNDVQAETIDFLQKQNKTISDERDEARAKRDQWAKRSIEIAKERDAAMSDLMDRNNELLAARSELMKLQDRKPVQVCKPPFWEELSKRPVGRIEAIEDRLAKLERLSTAR